jgi:cytoskeletal protein RodZ
VPLGTTLTNLRRERGKTLADIENATKIMGRMLSALENERWDELPAPVYVKGYIQNYASALGVDARPLLDEYARDTAVHSEHVPLRRIPERTVVPHRLDVHQIPRRAWIAIAVAVLVVALLVWGISALLGRDEEPPPIPPETTSTVPATSQGVTGSQLPEGAFLLGVTVAEGQSSWLEVTIDSFIAYQGTLPGGEAKEWTVTDTATLRIGKPSAVAVTRDGQAVAVPDAQGAIAEVTLAASE